MLAGFLPAVMDAVYEAAAIRPTVLPLTPEHIAELLDLRDGVQS
jgi:CO/xanthine dehydrogenase Mo-binding subunit